DRSAVAAVAREPVLIKAAMAMHDGDFATAEALLAERIAAMPRDAAALRLQGEVAWRQGRLDVAVERLEHTLSLAPGFSA
ncbi:hypothetical protein ACQUFG_17385, partial [Enterococcus gallinarum]|uniref:hypothetical protein n=1 Tax=Enterococcus gallinarum TaxID=1353 RepID=UPI003D0ABED1